MNLQDFIASNGITAEVKPVDTNPHLDDDRNPMDHWRVTLRRPGHKMTVYFSMGRGHNGKMPEAADVLDCLASDSASIANAQSAWADAPAPRDPFTDWCSEYGYDTDSRKAYRTFKVCQRQADRLSKFLGSEAYEQLLWETERL